MNTQPATNSAVRELSSDKHRELSTAEIEEVAGGMWGYVIASNIAAGVAYYRWLKANDKI